MVTRGVSPARWRGSSITPRGRCTPMASTSRRSRRKAEPPVVRIRLADGSRFSPDRDGPQGAIEENERLRQRIAERMVGSDGGLVDDRAKRSSTRCAGSRTLYRLWMKATSRFNEPLPNLYRNLGLLQQRPEKNCRAPSWQVAALHSLEATQESVEFSNRSLEISPAVVAVHRLVGHRNLPHLALVSDANDLRGAGTAAERRRRARPEDAYPRAVAAKYRRSQPTNRATEPRHVDQTAAPDRHRLAAHASVQVPAVPQRRYRWLSGAGCANVAPNDCTE
jgi:hypothetical protein